MTDHVALPWREKSEAGRTAAEYYEAAVRRWRLGIRPALLVFAALELAVAVVIWRYVAHGRFFAGIVLGAAGAVIADVWRAPPEYIAKWRRGSDGERWTAKALQPLEKHGWRSYHDRGDERGNLDHVLVGPAGVFLLDSKNLVGEIGLEASGLTVSHAGSPRDGFTYHALEPKLRGAAARLKERIEEATELRPWVQAVVVIWGDFPQGEAEGDRVAYVAGERLREWLLSHTSRRLSERDLNLIALAIDAGYVAPPAEPIAASAGPPARTAS